MNSAAAIRRAITTFTTTAGRSDRMADHTIGKMTACRVVKVGEAKTARGARTVHTTTMNTAARGVVSKRQP